MILVPAREARVRQDGSRVLFLIDGKLALDLDWRAADVIADAFRAKARCAEEVAKALAITEDQALLLRTGAPIGLTNHPAIQHEAGKLAAWSSRLRRLLPGGVRARGHVGTPTVIKT